MFVIKCDDIDSACKSLDDLRLVVIANLTGRRLGRRALGFGKNSEFDPGEIGSVCHHAG